MKLKITKLQFGWYHIKIRSRKLKKVIYFLYKEEEEKE